MVYIGYTPETTSYVKIKNLKNLRITENSNNGS